MPLKYDHREKLVQVLSDEALAAAGSPQDFFITVVKAAKLSKPFLKQAIALPKGHNSDADARWVVFELRQVQRVQILTLPYRSWI